MAKTRRKKINRRPTTVYGRQSRPAAVEQGVRLKTSGIRTIKEGEDAKPKTGPKASADAKPIFVNRAYTGVNKGKVYPYGSKRQGFGTSEPADAK